MAGRPETHDRFCRSTSADIARGAMPRSLTAIRARLLGLNGTALRASLIALWEYGVLDWDEADRIYRQLRGGGWYVGSLADGRVSCGGGHAVSATTRERRADPTIPAWWFDRDR